MRSLRCSSPPCAPPARDAAEQSLRRAIGSTLLRRPRRLDCGREEPGPFPDVVEIVVEIPRGSPQQVRVRRGGRASSGSIASCSSAVFYNFDYGFIEGTRAGDGDHTDALLIIDEPTFTGCHVWARPIGGLEMRDEKGFDFKVLCVAIGDAHQQHIERLEQVRPHRLVEIEHFFQTYKALEDKTVEIARLARARPGARGPAQRPGGLGARGRAERSRRDRGDAAAPRRPRWPGQRDARSAAVRRRAAPGRGDRARSRRSSTRSAPLGVPGGGRDVRWVRLDGLHLTLRFIGPTLDGARRRRRGRRPRRGPLDRAVRRRRSAAPGRSRRRQRPRALWLGVDEGVAELEAARACRRQRAGRAPAGPLEAEAVPAAPDARPLGRRPGRRGPSPTRLMERRATTCASGSGSTAIGLFESLTGGGPARYEPLAVVDLDG